MHVKRFRQRATLGARYLKEYLMDGVSEGYQRTYVPAKPLDVICEISYLCNLECPTCFRWTSKPDEHELTAEQWTVVLAKLKAWLGPFNLTFTGGEPFLRRDILDIFKFASSQGIVTGVVSNGSLIDKTLAKQIVESGLDGLTLSLNSLIPEVHNKTRGTNGAFHEVMAALDNMKDRRGMRLVLSTTIVKDSVQGLPDVIEFAKARGLYGVNFQPIMPATTLPVFNKEGQTIKFSVGAPYRDLLQEKEHAAIDSVFDRLLEMKERGYPILNSAQHLQEDCGVPERTDQSRGSGGRLQGRHPKPQHRSVRERAPLLDHGGGRQRPAGFTRGPVAIGECLDPAREHPDVRQGVPADVLQLQGA